MDAMKSAEIKRVAFISLGRKYSPVFDFDGSFLNQWCYENHRVVFLGVHLSELSVFLSGLGVKPIFTQRSLSKTLRVAEVFYIHFSFETTRSGQSHFDKGKIRLVV